jgi:hypothetical protein
MAFHEKKQLQPTVPATQAQLNPYFTVTERKWQFTLAEKNQPCSQECN